MRNISVSLLTVLLATWHTANAMTSSGRRGYGLIGYGIDMYKPLCAYSCRAVIASATLNCTAMDHGMDHGMMHGFCDFAGMLCVRRRVFVDVGVVYLKEVHWRARVAD